MASIGTDGIAIYLYDSVIRGHHVYKDVWTPRIGEILQVARYTDNHHDRFAVGVFKEDTIVGHVPREYSRMFYYFLVHSGGITCEITGRRKFGKGLEVPCVYTFTGIEKIIVKLKRILS